MKGQEIQQASMAFKKALIEQMLGGELSHHLGYTPGAAKPAQATNQRNGKSAKTVLTEDGPLRIDVPEIATAASPTPSPASYSRFAPCLRSFVRRARRSPPPKPAA